MMEIPGRRESSIGELSDERDGAELEEETSRFVAEGPTETKDNGRAASNSGRSPSGDGAAEKNSSAK